MMISTRGRYALRVMIDLAEQKTDSYVPLKEIAARQEISEKYLESILKLLVKGKILTGLRGKGGGYRLIRSAADYSVGEILEAVGEQLAPVSCLLPETEPCDRAPACPTIAMWKKFNQLSHDFFYGITLADLATP